jgi:hypothetical protein
VKTSDDDPCDNQNDIKDVNKMILPDVTPDDKARCQPRSLMTTQMATSSDNNPQMTNQMTAQDDTLDDNQDEKP